MESILFLITFIPQPLSLLYSGLWQSRLFINKFFILDCSL